MTSRTLLRIWSFGWTIALTIIVLFDQFLAKTEPDTSFEAMMAAYAMINLGIYLAVTREERSRNRRKR